jgi:2',3'-cyclic-nucleotide 2'-phosphodiesterase (5'-nucleotidase family)
MGNLFADIYAKAGEADIGMVHSGSLRKDIGQGDVRLVDILDAYPFVDPVLVKELSGEQIRRALEQSLTFERGLLQFSGLEMTYDLSQPNYGRIVALTRNGEPVMDDDPFTVAAGGFLAEGGDYFVSFAESDVIRDAGKVSDTIVEYFQNQDVVTVPPRARQWDISENK